MPTTERPAAFEHPAGRRFASIAVCCSLALLASCHDSDPELRLSRPSVAGAEHPASLQELGGATRPGYRWSAGPERSRTLELSPLEPGVLETAVAIEGATEAEIQLRLRDAESDSADSVGCARSFGGNDSPTGWADCSLAVKGRLRRPILEVRWESPETAQILLASPIHWSSGTRSELPPVFMILLDAARADAFRTFNRNSPYGDSLARLADDGVVFASARASSSWTRPAVATLFTGMSPWRHRVLGRRDVLASEFVTLAELFQEKGYTTRAWATNPNVLTTWGFSQGFDLFEDLGADRWKRAKIDAAEVFEGVRRDVSAHPERPTFYYVHLMDPHAPYEPSDADLEIVKGLSDPPPAAPRPDMRRLQALQLERARKLYEDRQRYDAEIYDLDRRLGEFFEYLIQLDLYDRSLILVVSDHGEEFGDHGFTGHGLHLYEEMLRIPAVLKLPDNARAGSVVERRVHLEDLHRVVLDRVGLEVPPAVEGGNPLEAAMSPGGAEPGPHAAVLWLDGIRVSALTEANWKLVVDHAKDREQLFDLAADPVERQNLIRKRKEQARRMRSQLAELGAKHGGGVHIRACGDTVPTVVEAELLYAGGDPLPVDLEAGDEIVRISDERSRLRFGLEGTSDVADEDEIYIASAEDSSPGGAVEAILRFSRQDGWPIAFGTSNERRRMTELALASHLGESMVLPGQPVDCVSPEAERRRAFRRHPPGEKPPLAAEEAYLRVWFVPPSRLLDEAQVDEKMAERLRALGYSW